MRVIASWRETAVACGRTRSPDTMLLPSPPPRPNVDFGNAKETKDNVSLLEALSAKLSEVRAGPRPCARTDTLPLRHAMPTLPSPSTPPQAGVAPTPKVFISADIPQRKRKQLEGVAKVRRKRGTGRAPRRLAAACRRLPLDHAVLCANLQKRKFELLEDEDEATHIVASFDNSDPLDDGVSRGLDETGGGGGGLGARTARTLASKKKLCF